MRFGFFYLVISRFVATTVYLITVIWEDVTLRNMSLNDLKFHVFLNYDAAKCAKFKYFIFLPKVNWYVGLNI